MKRTYNLRLTTLYVVKRDSVFVIVIAIPLLQSFWLGREVQSANWRDSREPSRGEAGHLHRGGHRETEATEGGVGQSQPDTE